MKQIVYKDIVLDLDDEEDIDIEGIEELLNNKGDDEED